MNDSTRTAQPSATPQATEITKTRNSNRQRLAALDGLRLLAAIGVVAYHYVAFGKGWATDVRVMFPKIFPVAAYGWLGVNLFFLISGFVICMSSWDKPLSSFFISRTVRLYPAYWFAVIATTAAVTLIPGGEERLSWIDILANLTMLQEPLGVEPVDGVYWTLFAELRFYLLFSLIVWRGLTYRRVILFCCAWVIASAFLAQADNGPVRQLVMPDNSWYFIAGIAFYLMYKFRPNLLLTGIILICFCGSLTFVHDTWKRAQQHMGHAVPFWPVLAILILCFGIMALLATDKFSSITWRWLSPAGALTYPLYLLHENIGWEVFNLLSPHLTAHTLLLTVTTGMLLLSWTVHRAIERPAGRWLKQKLERALDDLQR